MNKKTRKSKTSKAAKPMKDLSAKTLDARTARAVKGGDGPSESISLPFGTIKYKY